MAGLVTEGEQDGQNVDGAEPMRRLPITIYHCKLAKLGYCKYEGEGTPSKQSKGFLGVKHCHQSASPNVSDIVCDKAEVKSTAANAYVTKGGAWT